MTDLQLDGDPPDDSDALHTEEVEHLVWAFDAVAQPGAHVAFCLRNAVGWFANRKSKLPLTIEEAQRMQAAVAAALRAAARSHETKSLRHLRSGMAAITESIHLSADRTVGDLAAPLRRLYIRILKHEAAAADIASMAAEYSPKAWQRRAKRAGAE